MNPISLLWSVFVFALFAGTAGIIAWGAKKHADWSDRKLKLVCGGLMVGAVIAAIFVYTTDSRQRAITLFELEFRWESVEEKSWAIEMEHPGVEHTIHLAPKLDPLQEAAAPVTLRLRLFEEGESTLLDETLEFQTEMGTTTGSKVPEKTVWESHWLKFTPSHLGTHILEIDAIGGYPTKLLVRIEDPEKTDGVRAKGY